MRRGEGRSILLDLASSACLVLAVFLFVNHHLLLAGAAVVGSFALSGWSGRATKDGLIDEALAAREEWDRLHPSEDSPEELPRWKRPRSTGSDAETSSSPEGEERPPSELPGDR
ncbi:hypothetical protein [Kocuria sp.]|uniref:hypothetical protein n=1 Tax=Kocuria sp. TaxID=1871328 RepID=UPI0026DC162C|nr:hypothetical protein [Kocuria sp.]MDO4917991.1 hypothetical protein [Kocuria sp.]